MFPIKKIIFSGEDFLFSGDNWYFWGKKSGERMINLGEIFIKSGEGMINLGGEWIYHLKIA